jgi:hypothetical protein
MPDTHGPWDGSTFGQGPWYRDRGPIEPSGVIGLRAANPAAGDLGLTLAGFTATLSLGRAHVRGAAYERTGTAWSGTHPANTNPTQARIDRLVLRRNLATKTVEPAIVQGTPAASPVPPALTQVENGTYELPLFRVTVPPASGSTLVATDERPWIDPATGLLLPTAIAWPALAGQIPVSGYPVPRLFRDGPRVYGTGILQDTISRALNTPVISGGLPTEFRPVGSLVPIVVGGTNASGATGLYRLDVGADGSLVVANAAGFQANTYYFLDSLSYYVTHP